MSKNYEMLSKISREDWVNISQKINPTRLKSEDILGVPVFEINEIFVPVCERILSGAGLKDNLGNEYEYPYIIGVTGSVAVGKTTFAKVLKEILGNPPYNFATEVVSTDNFLFSNEILNETQSLHRKGFPESFNYPEIINFLQIVKNYTSVEMPVYSHQTYDITNQTQTIPPTQILIIEGINILQNPPQIVSDSRQEIIRGYLDFSIYLEAEEETIKQWYTSRFLKYCEKASSNDESFFAQFENLTETQATELAVSIWDTINSPNLHNHIGPSIEFADLILSKECDHSINYLHASSEWFSL